MTTLAPVKDPNAHHDLPGLSIPCSKFHYVLWVWQQVGSGTCASNVGMSGCAEWTIPSCKGTPINTPCVGLCSIEAEPATPNYTQVTMPVAVVIRDRSGTLHCQDIKP